MAEFANCFKNLKYELFKSHTSQIVEVTKWNRK